MFPMSLLKKCTIDDKDEEYKASNSALRLIGAICFSPNQFWIEELLKGVKNTQKNKFYFFVNGRKIQMEDASWEHG